MHRLTIDKLGPIQHCDLQIQQYTVLTGFQASGKSTIAKAIYFFRTLKDDLYSLILHHDYYGSGLSADGRRNLRGDFESLARNKFLSTFGSSYSMDRNMQLCYQYSKEIEVTIRLSKSRDFLAPNFVWVEYSPQIRDFLNAPVAASDQEALKRKLADLFDDPYETVYIPAGRSVLTVMGSQFNYFYSTMDDEQKRLLDSCTRDYLERVMRLRPQFANGLEGLVEGKELTKAQQNLYKEALSLVQKILKGKYTASDGEERIWVDDTHYVKINFASSGQQEIVWILNLLVYYLARKQPVFFIIEEPESNLFPESQKMVVELISLVVGAGNAVLLTTHSPYVLGTVNNLLYADSVGKVFAEQTEQIVSPCKWMDSKACTALFVKDGQAADCMDRELMQIDNSLLDQISHGINKEYDALFAIEQQAAEGDV